MENNRFVALWGSGGSGKTTLSIKIAKVLEENKKNVLVIHCDDETPVLPLLMPTAQCTQSLGHLLSLPNPSQIDVLKHFTVYSDRISLLGYQNAENAISYRQYDEKDVRNLFQLCRRLANVEYILVDCSSHTVDNLLTAVALETADAVIKVANANLRSSAYLESQKGLLREERFHYDRHINVLNNVLPDEDIYPFQESLGGVPYVFPHCPSLEQEFNEQRLLDSMFGKDARRFEPVMKQLVKEVFLNG
ncbi:AAA family ATPase [Caproiciproducens sp. LBM24188]